MTRPSKPHGVPKGGEAPHFVDRFTDALASGDVVGSRAAPGVVRRGVDAERVIGVDRSALRIAPLIRPGWGRAGIAYGPYAREPGLAFAVALLNGHNTSQAENLPEPFGERMQRWIYGSESRVGRKLALRRLGAFVRAPYKQNLVRRVRTWIETERRLRTVPKLDENLAVGWFGSEAPWEPLGSGNAFVMHALGPENGELWARSAGLGLPAVRGVQNLPLYLVVVLRERGAIYYAASLPRARGLGAFPLLRPIAVDAFDGQELLYPGVHQSALGQIGFRVDTRVYSAQVAKLDAFRTWYGTAHAADSLVGSGVLDERQADSGGVWRLRGGALERTPLGAALAGSADQAFGASPTLALQTPRAPSGLVHALLEPRLSELGGADGAVSERKGRVGLVFRARDEQTFFALETDGIEYRLACAVDGKAEVLAKSPVPPGELLSPTSVQVLDDGAAIEAFINGRRLFPAPILDSRDGAALGVGFVCQGSAPSAVRAFEAHPREVPCPAELRLDPPWNRRGQTLAYRDDFDGPSGDLAGRLTASGGGVWQRTLGTGHFDLTGDGAVRVRASVEAPNPGRTAYTLAWPAKDFAELEVELTPPGSGRGERQAGRAGFVFLQDRKNYVTVTTYVDDAYPGASVSSFFHIGGFEELYDAVWTMVGDRVRWGVPCRLRIAFDGLRYQAFLNDEPVLYRSLDDVYAGIRPLEIRQVGLVVNWEWGDDTGSVMRDFIARC